MIKTAHRKRLFISSMNFDLRNSLLSKFNTTKLRTLLLVLVCAVFFVGFLYIQSNKKTVTLKNIQFSNKEEITSEVQDYIDDKSYLFLSADDLSEYIKNLNPLIKSITVNKSIIAGLVLDVQEYTPLAIIQVGDNKYIITEDEVRLDYTEIENQGLPVLRYEDSENSFDDAKLLYAKKSVTMITLLKNVGIEGQYSFDLFGNLSILTLDTKTVKVDLKERYFSLSDQVQVLQKVKETEDYRQNNLFDLRFNNLLVKRI